MSKLANKLKIKKLVCIVKSPEYNQYFQQNISTPQSKFGYLSAHPHLWPQGALQLLPPTYVPCLCPSACPALCHPNTPLLYSPWHSTTNLSALCPALHHACWPHLTGVCSCCCCCCGVPTLIFHETAADLARPSQGPHRAFLEVLQGISETMHNQQLPHEQPSYMCLVITRRKMTANVSWERQVRKTAVWVPEEVQGSNCGRMQGGQKGRNGREDRSIKRAEARQAQQGRSLA